MTNSLPKNFNVIDTLEGSIDLPRTLQSNDVILKSKGNIEILYRGWVTGLHFDGLDIRCNAVVKKIQRTKKFVPKKTDKIVGTRKLLGLYPINVYETISEEVATESVLFEAWAEKNHDWSHEYIISSGHPVRGDYWDNIVGAAANKGVILSPQLRSVIFGSIEQRLMEFYEQVKQFAVRDNN